MLPEAVSEMLTEFRIASCESQRRNSVQFKTFTADSYKTIKRREQRREWRWKEPSKGSRQAEDKDTDTGLQTGGVDALSISRIEPEAGDMRSGYEQRLRESPSPLADGGYDFDMMELSDLLFEPWDITFPQLPSPLQSSMPTDEPVDAAVRLSGSLDSPFPQHPATPSAVSCPSDATNMSGLHALRLAEEAGEIGSPREDDTGCPASCTPLTDGRDLVCASSASAPPLGSDTGSAAGSAVPKDSHRSGYASAPTPARAAETDDADVEQAPESADMPSIRGEQRDNTGPKWTTEDDERLRHLRDIAGLSWPRIARYFPHTSPDVLRSKFTESSAIVAYDAKTDTQPKRGRGRPRKRERERAVGTVGCEHERRINPRHRRHRNGGSSSRPALVPSPDSYSGFPPARPPTGVSQSSTRHPPGPLRRGRRRKATLPVGLETPVRGGSHKQPEWAVDRIMDMVEEDGKQYYRVRWEDTLEPVENLRGCADTALADFHLRHLL